MPEPPYTGATAQSILAKILTEEPRRLSQLRPSVPAHVAAAVHKALEKLPADRFESAAELVRALGDPGFRMARGPSGAPSIAGSCFQK